MILRLSGFSALAVCQACMAFVCLMVLPGRYPVRKMITHLTFCILTGAVPGIFWPFEWALCGSLSLGLALVLMGRLFAGSVPRRIFVICTGGALSIAATWLAWWLRSLIFPQVFQADLALRVLLFVCSDLLLAAAGAALLGWHRMHLLPRGICALVACWSMELLVCSLFLLKIQQGSPEVLPEAVAGVCIFCAVYLILTCADAVLLRRVIVRRRWEQAASSEFARESERFGAMTRQLTTTRQLRHDFSNHLMIIQSLAHEGRLPEAMDYIRMLRARLGEGQD